MIWIGRITLPSLIIFFAASEGLSQTNAEPQSTPYQHYFFYGTRTAPEGAAMALTAPTVLAQNDKPPKMTTVRRPFASVEVRLGDVPFVIPNEWIASGFISISKSSQSIFFVNLHRRPAPTPHFEVPRLISLELRMPAPGLAEQNLRAQTEEQIRVLLERKPDEDGFWQWKPREYLYVDARHTRPLNQPLIIHCSPSVRPKKPEAERACSTSFIGPSMSAFATISTTQTIRSGNGSNWTSASLIC
jgi:hypothetical protein